MNPAEHVAQRSRVAASLNLSPTTAERHGCYRVRLVRAPMTPRAAAAAFQAVALAAFHAPTTPNEEH